MWSTVVDEHEGEDKHGERLQRTDQVGDRAIQP
jgi:hypothetical protein